jgi:Icc-related predicted phosphoesterase
MKALSISDKVVPFIYSEQVRTRFSDAELVIACGDLPYYYLEYVLTALNVPLFFVRGNHDKKVEYRVEGQRTYPHGGVNLHRRVVEHQGLLLVGIEGSLRYRPGPFQYSQAEMWRHVWMLAPRLFYNRLRYGRYLDVFVTHAPPAGIHDQPDLPHRGIAAFRWFLTAFRPTYHFHGHIHVYRPDEVRETRFGSSQVINAYAFVEMELAIPDRKTGGS